MSALRRLAANGLVAVALGALASPGHALASAAASAAAGTPGDTGSDAQKQKLAATTMASAEVLCSTSSLSGDALDAGRLSLALAGLQQVATETRVDLPHPYIPDSGEVELLLFRPFNPDEKIAFRVFFMDPGDVEQSVASRALASVKPADSPTPVGTSAIEATSTAEARSALRSYRLSKVDPTQVQAQSATPNPPPSGTDFKYGETTVAKTLLRFNETVRLDHTYPWQTVRMHVVGCAAPGASSPVAFLASTDTVVAKTSICALGAILLSIVFYILAAAASNYVRRVFREVADKDLPEDTGNLCKRPMKTKDGRRISGTNYAGFLRHLNPVVLSAGVNGRGNASKLQILFFSLLVFGLVSYMWMCTGHVSGVSQNVLLLMGISGVGATAAAGTDVTKNRIKFENYAWLINRGWLPKGGIAEVNMAEWKDIFTSNGEFDPFRFQMVTFSVFVGASLVGAAVRLDDLTNFAIPDSMLGILGISQAVYVVGKWVAPPTMTDLDAQLDKVKDAEAALRTELDRPGVSALRGVVLAFAEDDRVKKARASVDTYRQAWNLARTMFESTLGPLVDQHAADRAPPFPVPCMFQDEPVKLFVDPGVGFTMQLATVGQAGSVKWSKAGDLSSAEDVAVTEDGLLSVKAQPPDSKGAPYDFALTAVDDGQAPAGTPGKGDSPAASTGALSVTRRFVLVVRNFKRR